MSDCCWLLTIVSLQIYIHMIGDCSFLLWLLSFFCTDAFRPNNIEIKISSARELRAQLREIAPMNSEGSKIFCPNGPSANVSPLMENKCGGTFAIFFTVPTKTCCKTIANLTCAR